MGPGSSLVEDRDSWRDRLIPWYGSYVLLLALYWATAYLLGLRPELGTSVTSVLGVRILPHLLALYLISRVVLVAVVRERTFAGARRGLHEDLWNPRTAERLLGIPLFVLGTVFMFDVYGAVKQAIPRFSAYDWDAPLAAVDNLLHGGADPWRWSHRLFGAELPTHVLDQLYLAWYPVLILGILVIATWAPLALRARFFVTMVLTCAIVGSLAATLLASGGPVYFAEMTGDAARFQELLERLDGTRAAQTQAFLWEAYSTGSERLYGGVSAMPSMHVTLTVLLALAAWSWHRVLGVLAGAYALLIMVGSVHLGWHYAVDGYVGAVLTTLLWLGSVSLTGRDRSGPRPESAGPGGRPGMGGPTGRSSARSSRTSPTTAER